MTLQVLGKLRSFLTLIANVAIWSHTIISAFLIPVVFCVHFLPGRLAQAVGLIALPIPSNAGGESNLNDRQDALFEYIC